MKVSIKKAQEIINQINSNADIACSGEGGGVWLGQQTEDFFAKHLEEYAAQLQEYIDAVHKAAERRLIDNIADQIIEQLEGKEICNRSKS